MGRARRALAGLAGAVAAYRAVRVLHLVAFPGFTGPAEPAWDMVRGLRALGAEVDLLVDAVRPGNLRGWLEAQGERPPATLTLSTKAGPLAALRDASRLRALARRYDVVHAHLTHDHALAALALPRGRGPRLVRTFHAARALAGSAGRRWLTRRSAGLTVACDAHRRALAEGHGVDPARVLVLPGAVDPARFHPDPAARARVRAALGLDGAFAVGCVARFQAGRRHEVLLEALALARAVRPELRLVLIGHGETEAALRARAAAPDLVGAVLFPGYKREDLNDHLVALDAAAWLVNGNDATGRAVLQAMAAGLPVLGGAVDAIAEAVLDGETGALAAPDDPAAVARALVALAADPARSASLGAQGHARALALYSVEARARRLLDFYEGLLEGARP